MSTAKNSRMPMDQRTMPRLPARAMFVGSGVVAEF